MSSKIPNDFDGSISLTRIENIIPIFKDPMFLKTKEKLFLGYDADILDSDKGFKFITRIHDGKPQFDAFLKMLPDKCFGFDQVDKTLYFKGNDGKIYKVEFHELFH